MSGTTSANMHRMKKDESFLGKLGGTLVRKKRSKEVSDLHEEGKNAINAPLLPTGAEIHPEDTLLEENAERVMLDPTSRDNLKFKDLLKVLIDWINSELEEERIIVKDLEEDCYDGQVLQKLFAIHSKNLVAIVYLLVALAMHFQAPIRLPEHVSVKVVVVKKREGILQTALVTKELTSTTDHLFIPTERDAFDTLLDHAPDKLNVVKTSLITFVNKHLNKLNLEVTELETQVHNVAFAFELMQDGGLKKPKARPEDNLRLWTLQETTQDPKVFISLRGVLDLWSILGAELVPEGLQRVTVPLLIQQPSEIIESTST
ncbi:hypothetical protein fugu_011611 [Takifugu bimaculatus]|uniref:Calponin-homology (CH) domain-containing protein n=1 Tax=Takifugu bimaculatus TaxID=433685 RepID=A0A4Z2C812_9TELE|nr:hypothetical protein fugu_011611 [Takifugu bimaculatus]